MLVLFLVLAVSLQPATPPSKPADTAWSHAAPDTQKLLRDRAPDLYELSDGTVLDLYRIHRIRALTDKAKWWKDVKASDLVKLGAGHLDFDTGTAEERGRRGPWPTTPAKHTFKNLPALAAFATAPSDSSRAAVIFLAQPHVGELLPVSMFQQSAVPIESSGDRTILLRPGALDIEHITAGGALLKYSGFAKGMNPPYGLPREHFYVAGEFNGRSDGQDLIEDFVLFPAGTHQYTDAVGGIHTVQAYRVERLADPITPERAAELARDGDLTVRRYTTSTTGSTTSWTAPAVKLTFKP